MYDIVEYMHVYARYITTINMRSLATYAVELKQNCSKETWLVMSQNRNLFHELYYCLAMTRTNKSNWPLIFPHLKLNVSR